MRTLRAAVWVLLALAVAALLGAWLAVPQLDVNRLRGQIVALTSARLGRAVGIEGKLTLTLLPQPTLIATDVTLPAGDQGVRLTAKELRVHIAIGPLIGGRVVAHDVVLQGADLTLPWPADLVSLLRHAPRGRAGFSAAIEDGQFHVGGVSMTKIDATLRTDADTGTWHIEGDGTFAGAPWHVAAAVTRPGSDGSTALDATLDGDGSMQGLGGKLSAQIAGDGSLAGRISAWGPRFAQVLPGPAAPFHAEGRLTVADGLAAADDLTLDIGGAQARGAVALRVLPEPRLDLALAANRLDLDDWLPALASGPATGLPTGLDLSAEAATLAGGTLRALRCSAELGAAGSEITDARAVLPGDATVQLSGRLGPGAKGTQFAGGFTADAPALRTTLAWLQKAGLSPVTALPPGVLREASLHAKVMADPGQITVTDLSGEVDGSAIAGSLSLRGGARPAIGAGLTLDRLDLDPWLPGEMPGLDAIPKAFAGFDAELRVEAKQAVLHGLTLAPLSLDAGAEGGHLTLRSLQAAFEGVRVSASAALAPDGALSEGRLDLQTPQARPLTALLPSRFAFLAHEAPALWQAAAAVQVVGSGAPGQLSLNVTADLGDVRLDAQPIFDLAHGTWTSTLALRHPGAPVLLQALGFEHAADWLGEGSLGLIAKLSGGGGRVAADTLDISAGALHAGGTLLLDRSGPVPTLTGHLDAETLPVPMPDPRVTTPLPLAGLSGWNAAVKLKATRVVAGGVPVLLNAEASTTLQDGVLRLDGVTGQLGGGKMTGHATLETQGEAPPQLGADFDIAGATVSGPVFGLPLDLMAGRLDAHAVLTAAGFAPNAMLATLGGDVAITVQDGTLAGVSLDALVPVGAGGLPDASVATGLAGGATKFARLAVAAKAVGGVLSVTAGTFATASGDGSLSGQIDLPDRSLNLDVWFRAHPAPPGTASAAAQGAIAPPRVGVRLSGAMETPVRTPETADLIRWRAARAATDPP